MQSLPQPLKHAFEIAWGGQGWSYQPQTAETPPTTTSQLSFWLSLAVVLLLPPLLILLNNSWVLLGPRGFIDPFLYTGYFLDLDGYLVDFGELYYGSRLPWVLLGAIAHGVFAIEPANYALRLVLIYGGTLSLFFTVFILFRNPFAACITALLLGTYSYFLSAIGWDYVDGPGVVLTLTTMLCLAGSARTRYWEVFLFATGASLALMISVQLTLIILVPFLAAWFVAINQSGNRLPLLRGAVYVIGGGFTTVLFLSAINAQLSGNPWYFRGQYNAAIEISDEKEHWKHDGYGWARNAVWLVFPLLFTVVGAISGAYLWIRGRLRTGEWGLLGAGTASLAVMLAVCLAFALVEPLGYYYLEYTFYAAYLMPFVFLGAGALLAYVLRDATPREQIAVVALVALLLLLPFRLDIRPVESCAPACIDTEPVWVLLFASGALLLVTILVPRARLALIPAVFVLSSLNMSIADKSTFGFPPREGDRQETLLMYEANDVIERYDESNHLRFWFNNDDPRGLSVFTAIASLHLYEYRLVSSDFPDWKLPRDGAQFLQERQRIVVMSSKPGALAEADKAVAALGFTVVPVGEEMLTRNGLPLYLTFFNLTRK